MEIKSKTIIILVSSILFLWIAFGIYRGEELKNNFKITIGQINKITSSGWKNSGDYSVIYEYTIKAKRFTGNDNYNYCGSLNNIQSVRQGIVGKSFPVAYSTKDNSTSVIILTKDIAKKFNYPLSDSLLISDSILTCK